MKMGGRLELLEICCLLLLTGNSLCRDFQQTEHLSSYQLTVPRPIGGRLRRDADGRPPNRVSYVISVDGNDHVVHLKRNELLLPADFTVFTYSQNGSLETSRPPVQDHCHYQGYVQDLEGSAAAMSICNGLRGVLHLADDSYGIEPSDSAPDQHLVYRLQDVTSQPRGCGTPHRDGHNATEHAQYRPEEIHHRGHSRIKRALFHQTRYVELLLVVDNDRFKYMNQNETTVRDEMVHLANFIDSIYQQLNLRVVLVGLEIWTQQNLISTDGGAGEVLSRFTQWREKHLVARRRHDSAQLIMKKTFGGTAGMAFVSTICSRSHGGGINAFTNNNVPLFASIVAHELGHNLGMNHDDGRSCSCENACIMNSGATGSRNFSRCSADDFEKMVLLTGGSCLLNVPRPDEAYSTPYCGNRLVDMGEDCDCGTQKECEQDPCCEYHTCRLKSGAQCAYGECCYKCQYLPGGSVCRSSSDECDLPEFCNGSSSLCQSDVFIQNGHPCRSLQAICYHGKCQHYDGQCQAIFGSKAKVAPEICFKEVNNKGDRFGNCGYHNYGHKKCESRNAMCGKLQCSNVQTAVTVFGIEPWTISKSIGGAKCIGVDFMLGSDVPDPGMVAEGSRCGEGKVCMNSECSSADVLNYDCDVEKKCHGHGVCNSNRNCHCENGWASPFCEVKGYGGSVDSGPTWNDKDTSVRDGLLVFFFLVLPLLALGAFVFLRRNELLRRVGLSRRKRSQGYQADGAALANPSRAPPIAQPPLVTRGNANNIVRDGVVETSRTAPPSYALRPPPPPLKPKLSAASQPLVPQRPAPAPPV
ncbi:disintegrin and metalloproteinase domain-containing protein 9 isoform X2 [Pseudoliparis swirei]|uniref:disintegrin and metalloproteinase domain-containing protein 9 isoform X2 n=1 Tax=Pseudoliparis swirei TaxID=2059687 RepID=UPI0024BE5C4A|nr:disintegrin and metalloproteinase domain-containing protein 9 isoform X2 [Pseudoliparis swirei]